MEIVLIDDDATGVFLATWLLEKEGLSADLTSFVSPAEGLAYLQQQALAGRPPRLVLLDLNMPLLSGWEVLNALRPLEAQLLGRCEVYILTS